MLCIVLDKPAGGLKTFFRANNHGSELLQKILGAAKFDGEPGRAELDAGGQLREACADQFQGAAVGDHPNVLGVRRSSGRWRRRSSRPQGWSARRLSSAATSFRRSQMSILPGPWEAPHWRKIRQATVFEAQDLLQGLRSIQAQDSSPKPQWRRQVDESRRAGRAYS